MKAGVWIVFGGSVLLMSCLQPPCVLGYGSEDCDPGWTYSNHTGGCYKFIDNKVFDSPAARAHCESLGALAASSRSPGENQFLKELSPGYILWLGGDDYDNDYLWNWWDSTPFRWTHWEPGYPRNSTGYDCLIQSTDGWWFDYICDQLHYVVCSKTDAVRLAGGATVNEGRVEIYRGDSWGTVCDDQWDDFDARVVCAEQGYNTGQAKTGAYFGGGTGQVVYSEVQCLGTEYFLPSCPRKESGEHNCTHGRDAGVVCRQAEVSPLRGPKSGGTKLTISLSGLLQGQLASVKIGPHQIKDVDLTWNSTFFTLLTPRGLEIDEALPISLQMTDQTTIPLPFNFIYTPDPVLTNIYPLNTIRSGGTRLTVDGQYLDSVGDPAVEVTLSPTSQAGSKKPVQLINPCDKRTVTFTTMVCQTPNTTDHISQTQIDEYNLYLGFLLDGVDAYRNLSASMPDFSRLHVFTDPMIHGFDEEKIIESGKYLIIEGESMNLGCTKEDYSVTIGHGVCQLEDLQLNELQCLPPDKLPAQKPQEETLGAQKYYLLVQVGYGALHQLGVVQYVTNNNTILYVIIGCSVAGGVVIILTIIVGVLIWKRRKPKAVQDVKEIEAQAGNGDVLNDENVEGPKSRQAESTGYLHPGAPRAGGSYLNLVETTVPKEDINSIE